MKKYSEEAKAYCVSYAHHARSQGIKWKNIFGHLKSIYPDMVDMTWIPKQVSKLPNLNNYVVAYGQKEQNLDGDYLAKVIVARKAAIQANQSLHKLANDEARWQHIVEKMDNLKPKKITFGKCKKPNYTSKDVIYIVGDIHRRGPIDDDLFIDTFTTIKNDIHVHNYKNVSLWFTGDIVDGEIHEEQQRTNQEVIDNAIEATDLLIQCISNTPNIRDIKFVYGNHEEVRLWGEKDSNNNVGKFISWGLKKHFGDLISVECGKELRFRYKNKDILLLHGHQDYAKSKARLIEHCDIVYGKQPDNIIIGHFHTSKTNQFSKNRWLITAPAAKNWASKWDLNKGYCGLGQIVKLKLNMKEAQITTMNVEE